MLKRPRLRQLGRIAGLTIYLVDGLYVRNHLDIDFTCGGNSAIYPTYVPVGEIWLDDAAHVMDRMATTLHEMVELDQMLHHGKDYDHAHDMASSVEQVFRKELRRSPPKAYAIRPIAAAYSAYLKSKTPVSRARQLDSEIASVTASRAFRRF